MNDIPSNLKTQSLLKNQASNQSGFTNPFQRQSFTSTFNNQQQNHLYPSLPNTNKSNVNTDKQNINDFNEGSFPANTQKIQSNQAGMQNYNNAASAISFKPSNEGNTVMNPYENININNNHNNFDGVVVENDFHSNQLNSNVVNPVRTQVNLLVSNGNSASDANKVNSNNNTLNFCSNPIINSVNNCNQNYTPSQNNQMNNYNNQCPQPNIYLPNNKNLNHLNNKNNNNNNNYSHNPAQYQQLNSTLNTNESYSLPRQQPMSMELPVILNTANPQNTPDFPVRGNQLTANPIEAEDRDGKHLCWIIALTVLFGFFAGFYFCLNFSRIRRKELAVGVYLGVCFITTITHVLYFVALGKSSDLF